MRWDSGGSGDGATGFENMSHRSSAREGIVKFSGQIQSGNAVAWICVATPNSRQHVQAVPPGEFLIGSGPLCHLRLGDDCIPERLLRMTVDAHAARFLCVSSSPAVYLNGEPTMEGVLRDGDVVELGPYGLVFRTVWENAQLVSNESPVLAAESHCSSARRRDLRSNGCRS